MRPVWNRAKESGDDYHKKYRGLEWVYLDPEFDSPGHEYYIERHTGKKSRRKQWVIVDRKKYSELMPFGGDFGPVYPPKVAGPFKSLREAKTVLLSILRFEGVQLGTGREKDEPFGAA